MLSDIYLGYGIFAPGTLAIKGTEGVNRRMAKQESSTKHIQKPNHMSTIAIISRWVANGCRILSL